MKHTSITLVFPNEVSDTEARAMTHLIAQQVNEALRETVTVMGAAKDFPVEIREGVAILRVEPRT